MDNHIIDQIFETIKQEILNKINENNQDTIIEFNSSVVIPKTDTNMPVNICKKTDYSAVSSDYSKNYAPFGIHYSPKIKLDEPVNKKIFRISFYSVTGLDPLKYYLDKINIVYEEKGLYDEEINSKYMKYSREWGGSCIFLPCILGMDFLSFLYNTAITPYIALRYYENPLQYHYYIGIHLRRSMITKE